MNKDELDQLIKTGLERLHQKALIQTIDRNNVNSRNIIIIILGCCLLLLLHILTCYIKITQYNDYALA